MTAGELLALLGRVWPRLLLYPGGLTAFAIVWLMHRARHRRLAPRMSPGAQAEQRPHDANDPNAVITHTATADHESPKRITIIDISAIASPWLGLALLPLPFGAPLNRQVDIIVLLALLEWPLALAIVEDLRRKEGAARRIIAALNSYPPRILATLALVQSARSFELGAFAQSPGQQATDAARALYWLGAVVWVLALLPALGLGPFGAGAPARRSISIGLQLRAIGLVAISALPWALIVGTESRWLLPLPPLLIAGLLWGVGRASARLTAQRLAYAYLLLDAALLIALCWAAFVTLRDRLA